MPRRPLTTITLLAICTMAQAADFQVGKLWYNILSDRECEVAPPPDFPESPYFFTSYLSIPTTVEHDGTNYYVSAIGEKAFKNAFVNGTLYLNHTGSKITTIKNQAFANAEIVKFQFGPVEEIGDSAFFDCQYTASIEIPAAVRSIGNHAFAHCYGLSIIHFANNSRLEQLGKYAFAHCDFETITLPSTLTYIPEGLFEGCTKIKVLTLPTSITTIGPWAFTYCYGLQEIRLHEGITDIGMGAFFSCESLETVNIPESLTQMAPQLFSNCTALKNVEMHNKVTDLSASLFYGCSSLESFIVPPLVDQLDGTFGNCSSLKEVIFPDNSAVSHIGQYTFANCTDLETIELPDGVVDIDMCSFGGCSSLESITFGTQLKKIDYHAFEEGNNRTTQPAHIICRNIIPPGFYTSVAGWPEVDPFESNVYLQSTLTVPSSALESYRTAPIWQKFSSILPDNHDEASLQLLNPSENEPQISTHHGTLLIKNIAPTATVTVYNIPSGRTIFQGTAQHPIQLNPGTYIVSTPTLTTKIIITP